MKIQNELKEIVTAFFSQKERNMGHALGIEFNSLFKDEVRATMPVNENTRQPFGLLHGGASVALGETICSVGAWLNVDHQTQSAVGLEINANHLRAARSGTVTGVAKPIHRGTSTQIWQYDVYTESGKHLCTGRCTLAIISNRTVRKG
ncbi:putative domain 1-containing protein [Cyclonatronum proteinivorum]|uniref:Putative domain 1-containing protein n=1 Tax=Cyclonatronum proteinivorum TaxID=1457365 RepID=A0A345ULC3_9BACT|nr:hotdog fold thioesterase [Cyclonatronum proteinivorum]AXJ01275.1 putative domain 1-containing protein [Cyclonatronum proteinivorum]